MPWKTWKHKCEKYDGAEIGHGVEICPDCGQRGRFDGWHYSVIEFMSAYSQRTHLRPYGPHRALADQLLESRMPACKMCHGRGMLDVNNGESFKICPNCHGSLGIFDGSPEEFEALRQKIINVFPYADVNVPLTPEARQAFDAGSGFTGGGFFKPGPKDRSLQAYKDWANNMLKAMSPNSSDKEPMTEEQWEEHRKEFWAKMDSKEDKPSTEE